MNKKVLIIVENAPVPFDPRVWKEAVSLSENGYGVTVLCPRGAGCGRSHEVLNGIHIYRHPMPKDGNSLFGYLTEYACGLFWQFLYAWWIYLRRGFDIIQGCNPPDDIFLVALPFKLFGVKYVFDHHDANPELYVAKFGRKGVFYHFLVVLEKLTYRFSDVVMCTNSSYRDLALTRGRIGSQDAFVVRNGPNAGRLKPVAADPELKYGKCYLVGYVGNMSKQDGLDILIDVAEHIKHLGRQDVHFTCVGGGPELPALRKIIKDNGTEDIVNFTGRIPDEELLAILSTADVCVNPDRPCEMNDISTMIKIMEYMALGKPIVQFDLKEGRFSAGEASLYADKHVGAADFAAKILWLLDNPEQRRRMGDLGRMRIERELAWEYSVENLLAAYKRALERKNGGDIVAGNSQPARLGRDNADPLRERYRCPEGIAEFGLSGDQENAGRFQSALDVACHGQRSSGSLVECNAPPLHNAFERVGSDGQVIRLPCDPTRLIDSLRFERYSPKGAPVRSVPSNPLFRGVYYAVRPALRVSFRKRFQKLYFMGWSKIPFPQWPVDTTVENIFEQWLAFSMRSTRTTKVPFIWFWPNGAPTCTMMTHDVETSAGLEFCPQLMDLNDSFRIKSSFQIIPEKRYTVSQSMLERIHARGFEVNVHDLNHDGRLMSNRDEFLRRVQRINAYGRRFGAEGFRSGAMYRNADWFDALDFSYDMSFPTMAHLEPQRGGCCTVFPFFMGKILELPLTTTQDYSLFHILDDYSTRLWEEQIALIRRKSGLISFIAHPDYIIDQAARRVYSDLLRHLCELRSQQETWIALPREVAAWWRLRSELNLVDVDGIWQIQGEGSERARLAYAILDEDRVHYELCSNHSRERLFTSGLKLRQDPDNRR